MNRIVALLAVFIFGSMLSCRTYQRVAYARDWSWTPEAGYAKYFGNRPLDTYEGIWPWPDFRIALVKQNTGGATRYHGYVVQSDVSLWFAGDLRLDLSPTSEPGVLAGVEYLDSDRSKSRPIRVQFSPGAQFVVLVEKTTAALGRKVLPAPTVTFREAFINEYLTGRQLDLLEGVWLIADNSYEVGIIKNPFKTKSHYAYVGVTLESRNSSTEVGHAKMLMKQTAAPRLFPADYKVSDYTGFQGTNLLVENANYFRYSVAEGRGLRSAQREYFGVRTYPLNSVAQPEPATATEAVFATGTGFLITADLVITAYHVVQDSRAVSVSAGGERVKAFIAAKDPNNDLVVLKLAKPLARPALRLGDFSTVRVGETVYTIGFPLTGDLGAKHRISEGIVNSSVGMQDDPRMFQVSVPIQPGNSGGPLLNRFGDVIGVVTSTANPFFFAKYRDTLPQNVGFAVKASYLDALLKEVEYVQPVANTPRNEMQAADGAESRRGSLDRGSKLVNQCVTTSASPTNPGSNSSPSARPTR